MLWVNDKKIDTAFGRLRKRRLAVGLTDTAETPEQEAKRIESMMATAQATGDISTIISLISNASKRTAADFIKETCGSLLFMYYMYMDKLHGVPVDVDDMIDGLLYLDAKNYIVQDAMDKARQERERNKGK